MISRQNTKSAPIKLRLIFTIAFCLCIGSVTEAKNVKNINFAGENNSNIDANGIYIFLSPFEKRGAIEVEDSCWFLLRDAPFEMSFPLGRTIKATLPAGTKHFVPKGRYDIENLTDAYVEYQLLSPALCRE